MNQDEEGVPYTDHSGDEQHQNNPQNQQQVDLDLNATANGSQESAGRNAETGGTQNGQPNSGGDNSGGRRSTSAFDRLGPGDPGPKPFGGIGSDNTQIIQDLRHLLQAMEVEVKGLRKENVELKSATKDLRSRRHSPHRHPYVHLNDFDHRMICDGAIGEVKCRAFLVALTGLAAQWFTSLPTGSISTYSEIRELFLNEFITSIDSHKHPINLVATIDGLVDGVASLCLTNSLANEDFRRQLTTKPVWTRMEIQAKAKEFIHHEEVNRVVAATKNQQTHTAPRETYQQISYKGILPRARTLRGRTQNAKNKTLFCDYHQGYRHKTQDCYDLKDAIEQAIREGKLNEFIQIIREPRNVGRERSEGPETRNPQNLREADETMPIVPVITRANHT
ncbi:hypothetical protein PIB30_003762 [Stylosanthes scabra]|uniref:Retrotransposon gag domain-containing protein n=1 Tax=Stylosanthes scabra TaxID=79078 RepID=A0ABU6R2E1_9FABA|nr:hypothetical protein [Stylosanthes scabra]